MGDLLIQIVLPPLMVICLAISIRASGSWLNPVSIISTCFFLPLLLATFRLSGLQSTSWQYETYTAIWLITCSWLIAPTLVLMMGGRKEHRLNISNEITGQSFLWFYRLFAFVVVSAYLLSNYIQAGTFLPILIPEAAYALHTDFVPVLRLFARCIPSVVGLAYIAFSFHRKKVDLFILIIAILVPLSRLSRIDVALSLVVLICVFFSRPLFTLSLKKIVAVAILGAVVVIGSVELGNQRTNRFGLYEVSYGKAIKWIPEIAGPAGIFATLYGYFPLSFENFDAFVQQSRRNDTGGLLSFDWFFSGVIKLNRIDSNLNKDSDIASFTPISSAANVPTALLPFYSDFGMFGMIFPALLYMLAWLYSFYRSSSGVGWLIAYSAYTAAFSLASFQALVTAPIIFHQIILVAFLCLLSQRSERRYLRLKELKLGYGASSTPMVVSR